MRITVFGCGYVGLITAAGLAALGHQVVAIDTNAARLDLLRIGKSPLFEPGLEPLLSHNNLAFSDQAQPCDVAMVAVGTPSDHTGAADVSQLFNVVEALAKLDVLPSAIIVKSTTPAGTGAALGAHMLALRPDWAGVMISNPEFLRQGRALADFMQPERIVIGADDERGHAIGRKIYAPLNLRDAQIITCSLASAELTKYAANTLLATRLVLINELAMLASAVAGADIEDICHGIGLDSRIGPQFLRAGPGIGGSCFPKDIRALAHQAHTFGPGLKIVDAVIASNDAHIGDMVTLVATLCDGNLAGQRIAVLGVTFKAGTDDMRNSPALRIIPGLQAAGASVVATDPMGQPDAFGAGLDWATDAYSAATGADAVVVLTEWPEFAALDLSKLAASMRTPRLADLRNIFDPSTACAAGLKYFGLGRAAPP